MRSNGSVGAVLMLAQFGLHHQVPQQGEILLLAVVRHQHLDLVDEARRLLEDVRLLEIGPRIADLYARDDA